MKTKTKQELEKQIENYLLKASKHVYVIEGGYYYKILPLYHEGNLYCTTLIMGKDKVNMSVRQALPDGIYQLHGNGSANIIKPILFPEYYKAKSIPNFKRMRKLIDEIILEINVDNKSNDKLIEKIKARLGELEPVK